MAWTEITRCKYRRDGPGHAGDAAEEEQAHRRPLAPVPRPCGGPRVAGLPGVFDGVSIWYGPAAIGGSSRAIFRLSRRFNDTFIGGATTESGQLSTMHYYFMFRVRYAPATSAGTIGGQSVKTTEAGGLRGDAAESKVNGRKSQILTDARGLLVRDIVRPGDIQDRHGAAP
jgi:hypothetical protein